MFINPEIDGELEELKRTEARAKRKEQSNAKTMEELIRIGVQRGYKSPRGWAHHIMKARGNRSGR